MPAPSGYLLVLFGTLWRLPRSESSPSPAEVAGRPQPVRRVWSRGGEAAKHTPAAPTRAFGTGAPMTTIHSETRKALLWRSLISYPDCALGILAIPCCPSDRPASDTRRRSQAADSQQPGSRSTCDPVSRAPGSEGEEDAKEPQEQLCSREVWKKSPRRTRAKTGSGAPLWRRGQEHRPFWYTQTRR